METRKLYYEDSTLRTFSAQVLDCRAAKSGWDVVLDQTAFYPEGGGQSWDLGTLGDANVTQVTERNGEILHRCDRAFSVGERVTGEIDWLRRRKLSQQHSGEHIVSGIICRRYGYHNVGFHMGAEAITVDFDGPIPAEVLTEIEAEANEAVWRNLPLHVWYPEPEELARLPYRSKKKLEGRVRIVEIPGYDMCACCGTHVVRTGEIGPVKILSMVKFHQGVRMEMLCGAQALDYLNAVFAQNRKVSQLLSAKPLETYDTALRMKEELDRMKFRYTALENQGFARTAEELRGRGDVLLIREGLSPDSLRRLACAVMETCGGMCAAFSGAGGTYQYAVAQADGDVRPFVRQLNGRLHGRGGGMPNLAQGSVKASEADIRVFWQDR